MFVLRELTFDRGGRIVLLRRFDCIWGWLLFGTMILFETVRGNVVAAVGDEADDGTVGMREIGVVGDGLIDVDVGVIAVNNEAGRG